MKVCETCGDEIHTRDGDNQCERCHQEDAAKVKRERRAARNKARRERDQVMRDLGLVKVHGAMGGTYWE